jgi:hypothetical protein
MSAPAPALRRARERRRRRTEPARPWRHESMAGPAEAACRQNPHPDSVDAIESSGIASDAQHGPRALAVDFHPLAQHDGRLAGRAGNGSRRRTRADRRGWTSTRGHDSPPCRQENNATDECVVCQLSSHQVPGGPPSISISAGSVASGGTDDVETRAELRPKARANKSSDAECQPMVQSQSRWLRISGKMDVGGRMIRMHQGTSLVRSAHHGAA